ncbi:MAG: UDP-2,4-diacetamido-2,4,6-trideoxy-beta-L-altropyranose hydrolase [Clostridium sp.]|nr:UDP-2,4-diacetamido-2,4,6-trideoxy-beta-L-altropyranose hydrolase [Acetatifactor muris]MCM1525914.1 UDP-2,4-diacetamido-2,4,6-trideoxy-beta-L-altropyranose hydrolase [Bacteroides sp.]MCM1562547.1 UDP-2,4-diacetamido-2,4,6-trideoxy-beta-L-altropyranose hydrolase [Clostridium sp.]
MFIIRADGNAKIGAGHLMRCLTIGEAVRGRDPELEILFICADEDSAALAESHGFRTAVLHMDYRRPEPETAVWDRWVSGSDHIILVDSYYVTDGYLDALGRYGSVYLLDDLQEHAYPVSGVINYNLFAEERIYQSLYAGRQVRILTGRDYIPLRQQFRNVSYEVRPQVRDVLLTTGGGDEANIAGAILDALYRPEITYHVLVGRFSPWLESWQERASKTDNLRISFDVQDMASLMRGCDLAVSAGGSTLYELAAVGIPILCFAYAANQEALADYMGRTQTAGNAGAWHRDRAGTLDRMRELFDRICESEALRQQYSQRGRRLVDGLGADRIAEALCGGIR